MSEMVELVAKELFKCDAGKYILEEEKERVWEEAAPIAQLYFMMAAKSAIAIMREPTQAMERAGKITMMSQGAHDCEVPISDIYGAMIDAALQS